MPRCQNWKAVLLQRLWLLLVYLSVSVDEDEGAEGPVRVSVIIPGLKKKFFNNQEATNAKILFKRDERYSVWVLNRWWHEDWSQTFFISSLIKMPSSEISEHMIHVLHVIYTWQCIRENIHDILSIVISQSSYLEFMSHYQYNVHYLSEKLMGPCDLLALYINSQVNIVKCTLLFKRSGVLFCQINCLFCHWSKISLLFFRTFDLQVTLTTKVSSSQSREEKFRYNIRKLPDDIIPEKCTYKVNVVLGFMVAVQAKIHLLTKYIGPR